MSAPQYRMLIVEDDPNVGDALQDFFEVHDFVVTRALDGDQAVAVMQERPEAFDVCLLDVTLPGKSGFDVLELSPVSYTHLTLPTKRIV